MPTPAPLTLATLLALAVTPVVVMAADSPPSSHPCASIGEDAARLACYDRAFGRPAAATAAATTSVTTTTVAAAPASAPAVDPAVKARQEFGLSQPHKRALAASEGTPVPDSITATVASVTHLPTGESVVRLDSGQVWSEVAAYSGVSIKQGDVVTIRKASLGSFMLVTPRHAATRVRRLQ